MKKLFMYFLAALILFSSCSAKAQTQTQDSFPPEMVKAFEEAGLPLLRQKAIPRDFSLPLPSSGSVPESLSRHMSLSDVKGKVVFLNFWATWCGPCREEMPSMEALYRRYKDQGFEILAVNSRERSADVQAFMTNNNLSFPTVLDTDGTVNMAYGIQAIPTSYLIDRDGNIVMRLVGSIDWDTPKIHAVIELLLN
jgi:thiol-disulfide isomerase/thioredoxin